ncbi:NAD(P)-binding protein, partial [Macrolepiota fuliginosa MF-IS2]
VDVAPEPGINGPICHEFINGNLCDLSVCVTAVRGVDIVLHLAANMGGMGTIHDDNGTSIYEQNHTMTLNLLKATNVPDTTDTHFFYASSACVYPEALQTDCDVSLREADVFSEGIPQPQSLYGLEKLNSELLLAQYTSKINIRIARFHNIFGPGGSWNNGREKAPAAFLRKALACRHLIGESQPVPDFEIWGDGCQRRSFLFIDDAVDAIIKLLPSTCSTPVNIGSDNAVSIQELAELALRCAGARANFIYDNSKPVGVSARNSTNDVSRSALDWAPSTSLWEGMEKTCAWIQVEMDTYLAHHEKRGAHSYHLLQGLLESKLVSLEAEQLTFAILLPITSRGSTEPGACLSHLRNFVQSLKDTTWRDTHPSADQVFRYVIYLAVDADDHFLCGGNRAYQTILDLGIPSIQVHQLLNSTHPKGHVCNIWRDCAPQAYDNGCDYLVLMGDDVTL